MPQEALFVAGIHVKYRGIDQSGDIYRSLIDKPGEVIEVGENHESLTVQYKDRIDPLLVKRPANDNYWTRLP